MPGDFFGLPTHVIVVHAVVVLVPLAALGTVVIGVWPAARARFGALVFGLATVALFSVPAATSSGESLAARVPETRLVEQHIAAGEGLLPFMGLTWLAALVLVGLPWFLRRRREGFGWLRDERNLARLSAAAAIVGVLAAVGAGVQVARIGHSGARAVWHNVPPPRPGADFG